VPVVIPTEPDLGRMQAERSAKLHTVMGEQGIDAMILLGNSNVSYATGARWPLADPGRANVERPVAVVVAGDERPHLFTPFPEPAADLLLLPDDHLHGPVYVEFDEGAEVFARTLAGLLPNGRRLAFDELPGAVRRTYDVLSLDGPPASADDVIGVAKLTKTPDELGFLRTALKITEQAIAPVQAALAPGMRQTELTARFLDAAFEFGADANILDPIWQVMPARLADGPWTTHGDIACPLLTTERELVEGDQLWVDTGISYAGFASDFGRTWVVGREPSGREKRQFRAWREIIDAVLEVTRSGATGADLTRAALSASDGRRPWMPHFYLGHGLGIESAEPPFIGTDLGDAYDERQVLTTGTVVVLEPLVWDEGAGGYRAEEVIVITDDGWLSLTDYPYDPYGD
jgi:Xaa-Pro aminopeptidase